MLYTTKFTLKAIPKNWLTWNSEIQENNVSIGRLEFPTWGQTGKIISKNSEYRVRYKGLLTAQFFLYNYDSRLGYAQQTNSLIRVLNVNYDQYQYQLKAVSPLSKNFILLEKKKIIGEISSKNLLTRQANIDLPMGLPLELRLFVTWIVLWFWRSSQRNIT